MTDTTTLGDFGELIEPATLKIERRLPGPIERVWAYLTESDLRRQWLASGDMDTQVGGSVELVWRNDELTDPPGARPTGFAAQHSMVCQVTECDPPHRLAISWGSTGGVSFELKPVGTEVLLTLVHRRVPDRGILLRVSAGWHGHLDILAARLSGSTPEPFWEKFVRLNAEYDRRLPA
jgi:uncharacterized protein YndB with AHSA1/START domain